MKITKLTTYIVPPRWCSLKIETDEGITGWGEPVLEGRAETVATAVGAAVRSSASPGSRATRKCATSAWAIYNAARRWTTSLMTTFRSDF